MPTEISVSIVAAPWRRFCHAAGGTASAPQTTTGVASVQAQPLPVVELQRRDHRHQQHGKRQHGGDDQPLAQRRGLVGTVVCA